MKQNLLPKKDIADTLGFTFNRNSSNRNCSEAFINLKTHQEKVKLNFKSSNNEDYNSPFNLDELKEAISKSNDTVLTKYIIRCSNIFLLDHLKLF